MKLSKRNIGLIVGLCFLICSCQSTSPDINNAADDTINVLYLAWQNDNHLWASNYSQLIRWDTQTKQKEIFKDYGGELYVDSNDILWVFDNGIVRRFDGKDWKHFSTGEELAPGTVFSFAEADGYIWIGTQGLSRYSQKEKLWEILLDIPPGPMPTPIPEGTIAEVLMEGVHSIAPINRDTVWVGTSKGLTYWEPDYQQSWGNRVLDTDGIRCMLKATHDEVWICADGGVGRWSNNELQDFLSGWDGYVAHLIAGQGKDIWTTVGEGVSRWDGEMWTTWTGTQEIDLPHNIYSRIGGLLFSPIDGNIWVIAENGIGRWNGDNWRTYTARDGLTLEYIGVLTQGSKGTIWAGGRNGINYYEPDTDQWYSFP